MDESDCPTTPKEKQWEQNVTMVEEHSRIDAAAKHAAEELSESGTRTCSGTVIAHSEKQIESWRRPCSETRYEKINRASQVTEDWDGRSTKNVTV